MKRREFITLLGGAGAIPIAARAQRAAVPVIGYLGSASLATERDAVAAFHRGLAETGYVEGRNVTIEYRWAEGQNDRLPALATDLVRLPVAVIAAPGATQSAIVAKAATKTIPIVFELGADPVEIGLVASLNRPGGNITGVSELNVEIAAKRLEPLHELVPAATSIAFLGNPTNPVVAGAQATALQGAARTLGLQLLMVNASDPSEFEGAFATLVREGAGALLLSGDALFTGHREQVIALAARHAVPAIYQWREFTAAGGLMSYGASRTEAFRQVGVYTGRILKGDKPADLPVQQATKIELAINMKTAKALGLTIPLPLLGRADEVIE
jgi:putative tryptophan/tyrosine transport system substrate-binding protein